MDIFEELLWDLGGAWVTIIFANRHLFLIEVRNLNGEEVQYPRLNPPQTVMLQNRHAIDYQKSFVAYGSNAFFLPIVFCHTIVKQLTSADVTSGMLVSYVLYSSALIVF